MSHEYDRQSDGRLDFQALSIRAGSLFDIRIRIHLFFLLIIVGDLILWGKDLGWEFAFKVLFPVQLAFLLIVLLHEFGHCFGCRFVGGRANEVLLWPLGGLAFCDPPHQPTANLITVLAGPAVNVLICAAALPFLIVAGRINAELFIPSLSLYLPEMGQAIDPAIYLAMVFRASYLCLLFNLLPVYPMDGGRILQCLLWYRLSYPQATHLAATVGMFAAFLMGAAALYLHNLFLVLIAAWAFLSAWQARKQIEQGQYFEEGEFGYDFSQGYTSLERSGPKTERRSPRPTFAARVRAWLRKRREERDARLEAELDRVLEKIHSHGKDSLSSGERRTLELASKRRRQQRK